MKKGLAIAVMMGCLFGLFGCAKKIPVPSDAEKGTMLFDYYFAVVGLPVDAGHHEIVLNAYSADEVELVAYEADGSGKEQSKSYIVPIKALEDVYKVVHDHKMDKWEGNYGPSGFEGATHVVKFLKDNELIRVSTDEMPEDGVAVFTEIDHILTGYVDK